MKPIVIPEITGIEIECPDCGKIMTVDKEFFFLDFEPFTCIYCDKNMIVESPFKKE